jgi:disulfide oxidoreductase YuzD
LADIRYHDVQNPAVREEHAELIEEMEKHGLMYPVTVIDGVPAYDGAVSYPAILRAVQNRLAQEEPAQ